MNFEGKKLLILGGASVHVKLVQAAKELGCYTVVTDYLEPKDSPGKLIADESWDINIYDIETLIQKCREAGIDGVICGWLDPCQRPYQELCERLGLPCYGTKEQFFKMTDKHAFKQMCRENGVDVIPECTLEDAEKHRIEYPVFVKPVDSRGSRGQQICNQYEELKEAVEAAKKESSNGDYIIEKSIGKQIFQVTLFFIDGEAFAIRTADGYTGTISEKLDKVVLCSVSPSAYTKQYLESAHENVVKMLLREGYRNGPAMMQGFYEDGKFMFFDPGLRFPGVEFDLIFRKLYGIDLMKEMVCFSLTGKMETTTLKPDQVYMGERVGAVFYPTVSAGTIKTISGLKKITEDPKVVAVSLRHCEGETVGWTYNVNQRVAEMDLFDDTKEALKDEIKWIQNELKVTNEDGKEMLYPVFDTERIQ